MLKTKDKILLGVCTFLSVVGIYSAVQAAPYYRVEGTLIPISTIPVDIGTSTRPFRAGYFDTLCFTADTCRTTWPTGGSGGGFWPFTTTDTNYATAVQSTSTPEWFKGGFMASSTSYLVYASTTAVTATSICLTGDICRTTWPTSSSGSGSVGTSTADVSGQVTFFTSNSATPALVGGSSSFTWDNTLKKLTATYASTTMVTASDVISTPKIVAPTDLVLQPGTSGNLVKIQTANGVNVIQTAGFNNARAIFGPGSDDGATNNQFYGVAAGGGTTTTMYANNASNRIFVISGAAGQSGDYIAVGGPVTTNPQGELFILKSDGKTGIGSTTPRQLLSVQGNAIISGDITSVANLTATGTVRTFYASTTQLTLGGQLYDGGNSNGTGGFVLMSRAGTNAPTWVATTTFSSPLSYSAGAVSCPTCNTSNATVSSIATNQGLTGGTITTSGTIGLDLTALPVNNLILTYNGTRLMATGTTNLTAGYFTATNTVASILPYASTTYTSISSLTSGRVPFSTTGGGLIDNAGLTFTTATANLTATNASTTIFSSSGTTYIASAGGFMVVGTTTPNNLAVLTVASNTPYIDIDKLNAPSGSKHIFLGNVDGTFTVGTSTDIFSATSTVSYLAQNAAGHLFASTSVPTLSSGVVDGTDYYGRVTGCSSACTVTFAAPYSRTPSCIVQTETGSVVNSFSYTLSTTAIVVTETGLGAFNYICHGP